MAFSFTLPELQAELRALGHDGLPDHVILYFLSQLNLPLPSPSAPSGSSSTSLDSSGYDSEASFCSTHSLSCGYGSPNTGTGVVAPLSFVELANEQPHSRSSCQESMSVLKSKAKLQPQGLHDSFSVNSDPNNVTVVMHVEAPSSNGDGRHAVQYCKQGNASRSAGLAIIERGHTSPHNVGNHKPDAGCEPRGIQNSTIRQQLGKQESPDKIIEHYWISVGEEHMRAMHSKSRKERQVKSPPALELHAATSAPGTREGKTGYRSLIEKVEQCEDELQRLTLRLQAQQCKKPWFLEAARKLSVYQRVKHDAGASNNSLRASGSTCSLEQVCTHIKESIDRSELSVTAVSGTHTRTESIGQEFKSSSSDFVQECQEAQCKNLSVSEEGSEKLLDKGIDETQKLETEPASAFSVLEHNELQEPSHHQDQSDTLFCGLGSNQRDEADPSVCSKSSSASYQHSRSSGDSRSNASQQVSARSSSRRRPCSTLQQQRRRGGKIDRVARFAEMQQLWKKDAFLVANQAGGKRKGVQSFHHHFSTLHSTRSY